MEEKGGGRGGDQGQPEQSPGAASSTTPSAEPVSASSANTIGGENSSGSTPFDALVATLERELSVKGPIQRGVVQSLVFQYGVPDKPGMKNTFHICHIQAWPALTTFSSDHIHLARPHQTNIRTAIAAVQAASRLPAVGRDAVGLVARRQPQDVRHVRR